MKKTITFLLAVLFVVASASSQSSGTCGANATWEYDNGVLTISGTGAMTNFISVAAPWSSLKATITELKVNEGITSIGYKAFSDCTAITKVTLPSTLTTVASRSFYGCSKLASVTLPSALETIGEWAFYNCEALSAVNWNDLSNLKSIGQYGFNTCNGLVNVDLSACTSLTTLDKNAFGRSEERRVGKEC